MGWFLDWRVVIWFPACEGMTEEGRNDGWGGNDGGVG